MDLGELDNFTGTFARLFSASSFHHSKWNASTSTWELAAFLVIAVLVLLPFYTVVREKATDKSEKRSAWILTLCCSVVSSVGCLPKVHRVLFAHTWPADGTDLYGNDHLSRFLVVFFLAYLVVDSVAMLRHYRSVGGLHHHIPYFAFMALSIAYECPGVFVLFFPLEFSTIPLAIGHIWPERCVFGLFIVRPRPHPHPHTHPHPPNPPPGPLPHPHTPPPGPLPHPHPSAYLVKRAVLGDAVSRVDLVGRREGV